jgi:hypothetical protein
MGPALAARLLSAARWQTVATATLADGDIGASWINFTHRVFVDQASLLVTGGTAVRLTIQAPAANNFGVSAMYIGQASAGYTDSAPAFASTPTQLLFSGSASFVLASGAADLVSDVALMSIPAANGLAISYFVTNTAGLGNIAASAATPANWKTTRLNGSNDAATVAASGYTSFTASVHAFAVKKIEVLA